MGLNSGMNENFKKIVDDFSICMKNIDTTRPVYQSVRKHGKVYQPGIGTHTETKTVQMVVEEMKKIDTRLSNKSFMDRAPQNIVDQEKSNFANLEKDVKKIELTLKGL